VQLVEAGKPFHVSLQLTGYNIAGAPYFLSAGWAALRRTTEGTIDDFIR